MTSPTTPEECTLPEEEQNKAFPIQTEEQYQLENTESIRQQKQTLLVVDDDTEVAHYLKALLSPVYNVVCRFDADSAFKAMSEEAPRPRTERCSDARKKRLRPLPTDKGRLATMPHPRDTGNSQSYCREPGGRSEYRCRCLRNEPFEPNYLLALINPS